MSAGALAILVGGGPAPGINAVIAAATIEARNRGLVVLGCHDGYEWLYVLSGEMRLVLGEHDLTMGPGEVAEFDTRLPHWFGPAGDEPVEILSVHSSHGKRRHVRAAPRHAGTGH